ncbi:hypothetical protein ElyMa_006472000 [Elysia marginata]|uniref:Uncharacterized protein n=1 Tax=Elysia marginata TaxID=1093978 RepID=A0AAV4I487_9GAST|nr:hypothetical protein ElyMa_006472000 [Elysia marginata]
MLPGIELALCWNQSFRNNTSSEKHLLSRHCYGTCLCPVYQFRYNQIMSASSSNNSLLSLQPLVASSEGSDFDVAEMTDFDDFIITNDDLRPIDYIDRAMEGSDMPSPGPVLDQAQAIQEPAEPVNLNAEPQWSKQDFLTRQMPAYKRKLLDLVICFRSR